MRPCVECGRNAEIIVRRMCQACYDRHRHSGTLVDCERVTWAADDLLAEWVLLRDDGFSVEHASTRLHVSRGALDRALCRALHRGDTRGRRAAFGRAAATS